MSINDLGSIRVRIECANIAKMNKVRAWARRNGAHVVASRYARDAYEGHVDIAGPWNVGRSETEAKAAALRAILTGCQF